ncbi:lamin tail domain-containing protein [Haloarchaeobius litoreus]|uniref:Lamin tail domain-containing protein n=1 Tax=Haloarchaeobius litoreus TaxID=755306 RepID=A0ABD6DDX7_9EURY|nr:lamin tail domain-containing protein [Haloarchaeobius litoreus]
MSERPEPQAVDDSEPATALDIEAWTASETFWTRLEPRTRDPQIERPLRAEVHDPAWLLCRQWQVGEFQGEDAGSPVTAAVSYARDYLSRYELGGIDYSELLPGPGGSDLPITPPPALGGAGNVPVADERNQLDAVATAVADHLEAQQSGGGEPADAQSAFETYVQPGSGQTPSQRRQALAYLTVSVPEEDGTESTFIDRALGYLANQPSTETQVGGDGVDQLVAELVDYAEGSASWQAAATTFAVLLQVGGQRTTTHVREVVAIARGVLQDYDTAQSGGADGSNGDDSPDQTVAGNGQPYEGQPLEVLAEREPVTTGLTGDDVPPARLRADAGQTYLRFLAREDVTPADGTYAAADLADPNASEPERFLLAEPDAALDPGDRRFTSLTDGRAVDGHAVYAALVAGVPGIRDAAGWEAPSWPSSADGLPVPQDESLSDGVKRAATGFVDWYADLYDEPESGANPAWQDDRQEHQFSVATGPAEGETVLKAEEYPGGHLDWYSFSVASGPLDTLSPPSAADTDGELSESKSKDMTLSKLRYRGMPASRWWEFEDAAVNLDDIPAGPEELSKLLLLDFSLVHGDDWFLFPLSAPIGTLTRITDMTVTDTFGETTDIEPVTSVTDRWNAFTFDDLPEDVTDDGEPGLFLPPTLAESQSSDAVERVSFARDEMANLAFAVEERVESPVGSPLEREEFVEPDLAIDRVVAGPDEADERLVLRNVGDAPLDVTGWTVEVTVGTTTVGQPTDELFGFEADEDGEPAVLDADETVTIHTGEEPAGVPPDGHVYLGGLTDHPNLSTPVWGSSVGSVVVRRGGDGTPEERFVTRDVVAHTPVDLPEYELASSVPDHYFAMQPVRPKTGSEAMAADPDSYRLALALLLDADSMGDPLQRLPTPKGRILDTDDPLRLHEEEVTRAGRDVERHYQLARWTDGRTHLWSSRRVSSGAGEIASRLRYDDIVEPDERDLSAGTGGDTR